MSTCGTLRAPGKEILADKVEKCAFLPFLGPLFAHISSHSGIWEKLPSTRFTYSPIPGHMPNFRKIVWLKLWDLVEFCTFRWASNSSRSSRGPTHSSMQKHVEKTRPPRQNWAPCGAIWHTSSKGMPRHAHGRWALMRVCGVDVTEVTLSWWCVRWLVRKILE